MQMVKENTTERERILWIYHEKSCQFLRIEWFCSVFSVLCWGSACQNHSLLIGHIVYRMCQRKSAARHEWHCPKIRPPLSVSTFWAKERERSGAFHHPERWTSPPQGRGRISKHSGALSLVFILSWMAVGLSARDCNVFFNYDGQSAVQEGIGEKCDRAMEKSEIWQVYSHRKASGFLDEIWIYKDPKYICTLKPHLNYMNDISVSNQNCWHISLFRQPETVCLNECSLIWYFVTFMHF